MKTKIVSIVGRPNVGKSTIFNRIVANKRKSMTFDAPGVTRDGHYASVTLDELGAKYDPQSFLLVDTGGFYVDKSKVTEEGITSEEVLWDQVARHSLAAIEESDFCLVVVDVRDGLISPDEEIIKMLREQDKLFWLLINKCDSQNQDVLTFDFARLGLDEDEIFILSAEHAIGFDNLKQQLQHLLTELEEKEISLIDQSVVPEHPVLGSLAIIGAPNVGKSTLLNKLLGFERSIVSPVAGTTVDPVEAYLTIYVGQESEKIDEFWNKQQHGYEGAFSALAVVNPASTKRSILILDTAGIRRHASVDGFVETQSTYRSLRCLSDASLVVFVVDAFKGLTHQDRHLLGLALEKGKTVLVLLNKYDLVKKELKLQGKDTKEWKETWDTMVPWLQFCDMIPLSAKTGEGVDKVRKLIAEFFISRAEPVSTPQLNEVIQGLLDNKPLNFHEGKGVALKLKYASLVKSFPPTVLLFTNKSKNIPLHYRRYLVNGIRTGMDWKNTAVHLIFRTNADLKKREEYADDGKYDGEENTYSE